MFSAYVRVVQRLGFLAGEGEYFFDAWRVWNIPNHLCLGVRADMLLDLHPHRLQVEPHFLQNVDCNALSKFDQPEQKMLSSDVVMVEPVRLFTGESQDLLGTWSKVIHHCASEVGPSASPPD